MTWLQNSALFALLLTFGAYEIGLFVQKKLKSQLANPLLIAIILVVLFSLATGYDPAKFQENSKLVTFFLTPATICFALPMYTQLKALRAQLPAILLGVAAGTATCLLSVGGLAVMFKLDRQLLFSLLPKGITTALGVAIADSTGGLASITTAAIIVTGLLGGLSGRVLCRVLKLTSPIAQGVAFGTASHVMGTSEASKISELHGAASSLALVVAGLLTAILVPILSILIK